MGIMNTAFKYFAIAAFAVGIALMGLGIAAKSDATPVGQMDCGCGGGQECVTKNAAVRDGAVMTVAGGSFLLLGSAMGGVFLIRRKKALQAS